MNVCMCVASVECFFGGSDSKESVCNAEDRGSTPGLWRSPGGGHGNPLQYSCLDNPLGQRNLEGYSPWRCKESDTTQWLSTAHGLRIKKEWLNSEWEFWRSWILTYLDFRRESRNLSNLSYLETFECHINYNIYVWYF